MARRKRRSSYRIVLFLLGGAALFALGALLGGRLLDRAPARRERALRQPVQAAPAKRREAAPPAATPAAPPTAARIAILIDDLGESVTTLDDLAALGEGLSYAVLPFATRSGEVAAALGERGAELLLHLPMEARSDEDAGPGALTVGMSRREIRRATERALAAVPGAVGVNNHMGSLLSADRDAMAAMLGVLAERGLFYVDSRTSPDSLGFALAREAGLPAAARDVFLDPELGEAAIRAEFARLLALARERGAAIGIAHPHAVTLRVLAAELPKARAAGFELVPVSYLLERSENLPE